MNARAFIIAIEDYSDSISLATTLPGTNQDAEAFRAWLMSKKITDSASILACAGPACAWRTAGTTHDEIVAELLKLANTWKDKTDELYFYFSGHGFSYKNPSSVVQVDVLVASDFVDPANSGDACLSLQEIQQKLWNALGPGHHYYFIDACRNPISIDDIEVTNLGKKFPTSVRGKSNWYVLYSTAQGMAAKVKSGFTKVLVQGLNGSGKAKKWEGNRMCVTFQQLRDYVKANLRGQESEAKTAADGDGFIMELNPVPEYPCEIVVDNASAEDAFTLRVSHALIGDKDFPFQGNSYTFPLKPFDYFMVVSHASAPVVQVEPPPPGPLSVYDPVVVRFKKQPGMRGGPHFEAAVRGQPVASPAKQLMQVVLEAGPGTKIELVNLQDGSVLESVTAMTVKVPAGSYVAKVLEQGIVIESRPLTVELGKDMHLDLLARPKSDVRESILDAVSDAGTYRYASFSESLGGPISNWDLNLWLAVLGASRIVREPDEFSKLKNLPLASFRNAGRDEAYVYVLAGFEKSQGQFEIALGRGPELEWSPLREVQGLIGIYEGRSAAEPGSHLFSIKMPGQSPITLATYCLPNRATLVTLAEDAEGRLKVHQFLLPIHSLFNYLAPEVLGRLNTRPLSVVRTMSLAQNLFANNQAVKLQPGSEASEHWDDLMYGKWLDPIMSLIAAYEIIRRGELAIQQSLLETVVDNLRRYFSGIPDIEVIAKLIGLEWNPPVATPLLLDGLLVFEALQDTLLLPAGKLDYGSFWTTWRGAVR